MEKSVDEEILELSDEQIVVFGKMLESICYSDRWKAPRGLQNASEQEIARVLYGEMYRGDYSHLVKSILPGNVFIKGSQNFFFHEMQPTRNY